LNLSLITEINELLHNIQISPLLPKKAQWIATFLW